MIGLLPASGKASRIGGIPKFLLPTISGELLIEQHIRLMRPYCDEIRVCTNSRWIELLEELLTDVTILQIEPSTMNAALLDMYGGQNLIGMPDTFFLGFENPYQALADSNLPVGIALWRCTEDLRGKVGQVDYREAIIHDIRDKDPKCDYEWMWGALRLDADPLTFLKPEDPHPGYNLKEIISRFPYHDSPISGRYIDVGTAEGLRDMLNAGRVS